MKNLLKRKDKRPLHWKADETFANTSHYHGPKTKGKTTDHFFMAFNKYRLIRTALPCYTRKPKTATILKHRGISFIKRNMMALMMIVHKHMNLWRGHSLWPQ